MPSRIILAVAAIAIIGWLVYRLGKDQNAEEAQRLARQAAQITSDEKSNQSDPNMIRLTGKLVAERDPNGVWYVDSPSHANMQMPYRPDVGPQSSKSDPPEQDANPGFVGAAACAQCHRQRHESFVQTAHHKTSAVTTPQTFNGPLSDASTVQTKDSHVSHQVVQQGDDFFQSISFHGWQHHAPMQIVTGSAKMGQTYLYWHDDGLYQTHISYTSPYDEWIPSPGFTATDINLTRPITIRCLECHVTFIQQKKPPNFYHRESAVFGISCERCHGPGRQHIKYHQQHPQVTDTKYIAQPADLTRQQQLDICSQCHSGLFTTKQAAFSFRPGDNIEDHHQQRPRKDKVGSIHTSNQLILLKKSACFQQSDMTCTSCHDPHRNERGDTALFSQSCLQCHQQETCGMHQEIGESIVSDCINCHMPMTEDQDMPLTTQSGTFFPAMVDHHIRVDRQATEDFLKRHNAPK